MSVNINNLFGAYVNQNTSQNVKRREENQKAQEAKKAQKPEKADEKKQPKLSEAAQRLLEKLQKTYGNMDFMIADFETDEEAQEIMARGTKDFSVLISPEELEKMAADEEYEKEMTGRIEDAVRMSEEITKKYNQQAGEDSEKGEITRMGVVFNSDGSTTFFAELEKSSSAQRDIMEKGREKRAEEKKEAEKKEAGNAAKEPVSVKRTMVKATSAEELLQQMNAVDWSKIPEEKPVVQGGKFDFSI